jgi:hypothetical protein
VEHSIGSLDAVRPWRTATLVTGGIAALELAALIAVGVIFLAKPLAHHAESAAQASLVKKARPSVPRETAPGKASLPRRETSILVLNGNGVSGAAAATAARVRARGYLISGVGNAKRGGGGPSVVMFRPGFRAEAARLARDLRIGSYTPLDGLRTSDLMGAHLAVVVGT